MGEILLVFMVLAFFALGYIMIDHFGKFADEVFTENLEPEAPDRTVFIAETGGKSSKEISKEVGKMLDSFPERESYEIIICKRTDPCIINWLEKKGRAIEYSIQR